MNQLPTNPLPRRVAWFAPWTWRGRQLVLPSLFATWLLAIAVIETDALIWEHLPAKANPILPPFVGIILMMALCWVAIAPCIALILIVHFVVEYYDSQ